MIATAAWVLAGIALWFSRSVLDVFSDAGRTTRVAMLPSVPELLGCIVLMLVAGAGLVTCIRRWTDSPDARSSASLQISLPLFGLILTIVPYLPWLPDDIDPIRALAGPLVRIIWFAIAGQVILTFFSVRSMLTGKPGAEISGALGSLAAPGITAAIAIAALLRIRGTLTWVALTSDVPAFFSSSPHVAGGISIALAAAMAALIWRWVFAFTGSTAAAAFSWVAICLSAPLVFTSVSSYPDTPAAFCVLAAVAWKTKPQRRETPWLEYLMRGLAISALPWLSVTYIPMAVIIAVLLGVRAVKDPKAVLAVMVPFTVSVVRRLAFSYDAPVLGNPMIGVFGLLFDQEFGVLIYAPALTLGLVGVCEMLVARDTLVRRRGGELGAVVGLQLLSAAALVPWWQTLAPPGRPLVPVLPLLALPIAWSYLRAPVDSVRRSTYHLLALLGLAITLTMIVIDQGALIAQDRDGSSRFLQWITALWPAWQAAPSVVAHGVRGSVGLIALWIGAALAVAWISRRNPSEQPGASALMATVNLSAAVMVVALLAPAVNRAETASVTTPQGRSRLPMLDDFDSVARPHAIIYRPFTLARAADIPPLMTLAAEPGLRTGGQPVRVLLNARYALAAGDYAVEIGSMNDGQPVHGTVGLQAGRMGGPMREWEVDLQPGESWHGEFSLPVDVEFVGFVVTDSLSSARSLRITPLRIIDKNNRESTFHGPSRTVLAAIQTPAASLFFHDEDIYTEKNGFWVKGESTAFVTVAVRDPTRGVVLRVHSGAIANVLTLATPTWGERVALVPGTPHDVHVPAPARPGPFLLRVAAEKGFAPAEFTPGSSDRRTLGCWIEIAQE